MKTGQELMNEILALPAYKRDICNKNEAERLLALSDLYDIYIPSQMTQEIYSKLYLALLHSLKSKGTKLSTKQHNENFKACKQLSYNGIMGGLDSFTIIGCSGIGKSTTISKVISLITENKIIELQKPFARILPCLIVQCPFDSSVKGLLLEILRKTDEYLGSKYYHDAIRTRATTDMLIGSVSQVALNHIGILVVDEIQNVLNNKHGKSLVGMLTQLINNSGISICMVGTPESKAFFESEMQLARRSIGLQYSKMAYNQDFCNMCDILFGYQYTKTRVNITDDIKRWLYEHSNGISGFQPDQSNNSLSVFVDKHYELTKFYEKISSTDYRNRYKYDYNSFIKAIKNKAAKTKGTKYEKSEKDIVSYLLFFNDWVHKVNSAITHEGNKLNFVDKKTNKKVPGDILMTLLYKDKLMRKYLTLWPAEKEFDEMIARRNPMGYMIVGDSTTTTKKEEKTENPTEEPKSGTFSIRKKKTNKIDYSEYL